MRETITQSGNISYYKDVSSDIDRKINNLKGDVVTISYLTDVSKDVYYHDFYNYEIRTMQGKRIECQVRIDENTGDIAEIVSAKKIEFSDSQTSDIHKTEHENTILNSEEISPNEVDIELLKKNYEFAKSEVLPKLKDSQEACHKYLSILQDAVKCTYNSKNGMQYIYIKQDGEITDEPRLIEKEGEMPDGDIFYVYDISYKVIDTISDIPEEYIKDMKSINTMNLSYISTKGVELLGKDTREEFIKLYGLPLNELAKISNKYNQQVEELNRLKYSSRNSSSYKQELEKLNNVKANYPSKEEIFAKNAEAQQQYQKDKEEYDKKYGGIVGLFRRIFRRPGLPMIEAPLESNYKGFTSYEGFTSIEQLEEKIAELQKMCDEYERMKQLETIVSEDQMGSTAEKILKFRKNVETEIQRASARKDKSNMVMGEE